MEPMKGHGGKKTLFCLHIYSGNLSCSLNVFFLLMSLKGLHSLKKYMKKINLKMN